MPLSLQHYHRSSEVVRRFRVFLYLTHLMFLCCSSDVSQLFRCVRGFLLILCHRSHSSDNTTRTSTLTSPQICYASPQSSFLKLLRFTSQLCASLTPPPLAPASSLTNTCQNLLCIASRITSLCIASSGCYASHQIILPSLCSKLPHITSKSLQIASLASQLPSHVTYCTSNKVYFKIIIWHALPRPSQV